MLTLDSSPGDRHEIGLFTEWASECMATGRACDHVIAQADHLLNAPWCDLVSIYKRKWAGGEYGLSYEHAPNAFFLPYLLTNDPKYIAPMECIWKTHQELRYDRIDDPLDWMNGRDLAWTLRTLGELAYLEGEGKINHSRMLDPMVFRDDAGNKRSVEEYRVNPSPTLYRDALEATRLKLLEKASQGNETEFHSLSWKGTGFNSWMEAFIGMTLNHFVQLGLEKWRPLAEWHFQHLVSRCGGEWLMKYCGSDYVSNIDGMTWGEAEQFAFTQDRMEVLADYPNDKMTPNVLGGKRLTYGVRRGYLMAWAKLARQNNLNGAHALVDRLAPLMSEHNDKIYHKNNFQ